MLDPALGMSLSKRPCKKKKRYDFTLKLVDEKNRDPERLSDSSRWPSQKRLNCFQPLSPIVPPVIILSSVWS